MIRRALILVALLLSACSLAYSSPGSTRVPPPRAAGDFALPARALAQAGDPVVRIIVEHQSGTVEVYDVQAKPVPTVTPLPTIPPTNTPRPTDTPMPTATATPTPDVTEPPEPTPTQEITPIPTIAPGPTITPKMCQLRAGYGINVRSGPGTDNALVGSWVRGTDRTFDEFRLVGTYLWAHSSQAPAGWSVVYDDSADAWWVYGSVSSGVCPDVRGWPDGLMPPTPFAENVRGGPHLLMGEGASVVLNYAANITAAKCLPGSFQLCQTLKAYNPDIFIIYRSFFHDCPAPAYYTRAWDWWVAIRDEMPAGADAYEFENECSPPDDLFPQWVQFSIDMAQIVQQQRNAAVLAFSFGPGHPNTTMWPALIPYIQWVAAHPLPDGRFHGIAIHSSPYATFARADMPWVNWIYIAGRMNLARDVVLANGGPDLKSWPGQLWVTEIGLGDGYSGTWKAPYTCTEAADAYHTTLKRYAEEGMVTGITWWNFGAIQPWSSDHDCADEMFTALQ